MMFRRRFAQVVSHDDGTNPTDTTPRDAKNRTISSSRWLLMLIALVFAVGTAVRFHQSTLQKNDTSSLKIKSAKSMTWFDVPRNKFAIVQFDGRRPWETTPVSTNTTKFIPTIHNTGSVWNHLYTQKQGHEYILYHWGEDATTQCRSNQNQTLAEAWCKIKAMIQAQDLFPEVDYFLYLDTDNVVDIKFHYEPLNNLLHNMTTQWNLNWTIDAKPFTFNMEGPSYWCKRVREANFTNCINTGTVLWKRSVQSTHILQQWWDSADDSYEINNPLGYKFRTETPWEQVKAQYLLTDPLSMYIQIVPQPHATMQGLPGVHEGYCLSDCWLPPMWEQLGCFALHYCMKKDMVEHYGAHVKDYLEHNQIEMKDACYPRAVLDSDNAMRDVAACHAEWIGHGEQIVNIT